MRSTRDVLNARSILALASAIAGCTGTPSERVESRVSTWLPISATKNSAASLDGLDDSQHVDPSASPRPVVKVATVIGRPLTKIAPWPSRLLATPASIEQAMLVKTIDNRYFSTALVWRDELIPGSCVEDPQLCAKFEQPHQVSETQAKALLRRNPQYTAILYQRFFVDDASKDQN